MHGNSSAFWPKSDMALFIRKKMTSHKKFRKGSFGKARVTKNGVMAAYVIRVN